MAVFRFEPLRPGVALMRRIRLPLKLALMGAMLLLPLLLMIAASTLETSRGNELARAEAVGVRMIGALTDVAEQLQVHRGLTVRAMQGDTDVQAELSAARGRLRAALDGVDALVARHPSLRLDEWPSLRGDAATLADGRHSGNRMEMFSQHSAAVESVHALVLLSAERSGLLLDPQAGSRALMDLSVERIITWTELIALTADQGSALLVRGGANAAERATMIGRTERLRAHVADMSSRIGIARRAGIQIPASWDAAADATRSFADQSRETFANGALTEDPAQYYEQGRRVTRAVLALNRDLIDTLNGLLEQRVAQQSRDLWLQLGLSAVGLLILWYPVHSFYVGFVGALRHLRSGVERVASGDLSHRIEVHGRDEMAEIGRMVEQMSDRLSAMVSEIRTSAVRVGMAGQQVSGSNEDLSRRTDSQASTLRQTVAAVGDLSGAVASNAAAAAELDGLTGRLRGEAEQGGAVMRRAIDAITAMEAGSKRVGEIIGVIDGIAFQTNILALNAAVEAARAGDSGRGFAVVAAEVRQLAQRSASAAAEIRGLIGQSTAQVGGTVQSIQHVGQVLEHLVSGVRTVADRLRSIAAASEQQSSGLQQLSHSVGSLDEITRQNAAMVEHSASASLDLVARARRLTEAVGSIRLRQGSADEARALVERAMRRIREIGLPAAAAEFRRSDTGFVDRDLYVFVIDRAGCYRVHGAKPAMEGRRVHEVPGIDGESIMRDA